METRLTKRETDRALAIPVEVGQAANGAAAAIAFVDYRSRRAANTIRRQDAALALFSEFLGRVVVDPPTGHDLATRPGSWQGITWGLVSGFAKWMVGEGYAIGTINVRLSTVKTYCKLAARSGALSTQELAMIRLVEGYSRKEGKRVDERRELANKPTRLGKKKAEPVVLSTSEAEALRDQPDTPQGRRDALLLALLLDLGLRAGEVAGLNVGDVNLDTRELTFWREKVDKAQTFDLMNPRRLWETAEAWFADGAAAMGALLRSSRKGGELTKAGMTARCITERVRYLGKQVGIEGLSSHDLRHFWATTAARNDTPLDRLMEAGGWASPAMPMRYIEAGLIANEGVRLS